MLSLTSEIATPWHRVRAGRKLVALAAFTAGVLAAERIDTALAALAVVTGAYGLGGWPFLREGLRALRPLAAFLVVLALWHGLSGTPRDGIALSARLLAAVGAANLVTLTTRLDEMRAVVDRLAAPLGRVMDPQLPGLALALVVRFVPALVRHATALAQAWRARSHRRASWRIVMPLAVRALDDADHVAEALRARGGLQDRPGETHGT